MDGAASLQEQLQVGDQVIARVTGTERYGVVKFIGNTAFAEGEWIGVELDEKVGKNDGTVNGKFYFASKPRHGLFVRGANVSKVHATPSKSIRLSKGINGLSEVQEEPMEIQLLRGVLQQFTSEAQDCPSEDLVNQIVGEMETRLWPRIEVKLHEVVEGAVEKAISSFKATQTEVRRLSQQMAILKETQEVIPCGTEANESKDESSADEADFAELQGSARPSTYEDALILLGGSEEVQKFAEQSEELRKQYDLPLSIEEVLVGFDDRLAKGKKAKLQPYVDSLEELRDLHLEHLPSFQKKMRQLARRSGGRAVNPEMKGEERARAKAQFKHSEGDVINYFCLTDLLRDTIEYASINDMYTGLEAIHQDKDTKIIEVNDRYQKPLPDGYRDIQLALRYKDVVCELQLNTWHMLQVKKNEGHRAFEIHRELLAAVVQQDAGRCQRTLKWANEILGENAEEELHRILNNVANPFLHQAAKSGQATIVNLLLKSRADVQLQLQDTGRTALHESLAHGHRGASWALLCHRADPKARSVEGFTPMMDAFLRLRVEPTESLSRLVCLLAEQVGEEELQKTFSTLEEVVANLRKPSSELLFAAADGDLTKTQRCLKDWADPGSCSEHGETACHLLLRRKREDVKSKFHRLETLKVLLEMRASPNAIDHNGRSVLGDALRSKNLEAILLLIVHGCSCGDRKLADLLSEAGGAADFVTTAKNIMDCYRRADASAQLQDLSIECLEDSLNKEELHGIGFTLPELLVSGFQFNEVKAFYHDVGMDSEEDLLHAVLNAGLEPKDVGERCLVQADFLQRHLTPRKIRVGDLVEIKLDRSNISGRHFGTVKSLMNSKLFCVECGAEGDIILDLHEVTAVPLCRAAPSLCGDWSVVATAVKRVGRSLCFAADHLKGDRELVLLALDSDGLALEFASPELREDREVVLRAVKADGEALQFARVFQDDPQVVLAAVKSVGSALQYASVALRSHSTFVRAAILADGSAMQYALGSWAAGSSQNATVTMAVSRSRLAYGHAPHELQEAEDVAAKAVQHGLPREEVSPVVRDHGRVIEAEKKRLEQAEHFRSLGLAEKQVTNQDDMTQKDYLEMALKLDAANTKAWMSLATLGGGKVDFQHFSPRKCLTKAVEIPTASARSWCLLGLQGGGLVHGNFISDKDCFERSLALEATSRAWSCLGTTGGGQVGDKTFTPKECFERALKIEGHSPAWIGLGRQGGGRIDGQDYNPRKCFELALEMDPDNPEGWLELAKVGGGQVGVLQTYRDAVYCATQSVLKRPSAMTWSQLGIRAGEMTSRQRIEVNGRQLTAAECFVEALQDKNSDPSPDLWVALAIALRKETSSDRIGIVDGRRYDPKQCLEEAFTLDSNFAPAFLQMGILGGNGTASATVWLVKAVESNPQSSENWLHLGKVGGGSIGGIRHTQRKCIVQSLRLDMKNAEAWHQLGLLNGGMEHDARECLEKSLELDDSSAQCWYDLGKKKGGNVNGKTWSQQQCFEQSLQLNSSNAAVWLDAGSLSQGCHVGSRFWSPVECFQKCLELDEQESLAWILLGLEGGGDFDGRWQSKVDCCAKALEINETHSLAWLTVGMEGGGTIRGRFWSKKECYEKSLDINEGRSDAWLQLSLEGGGQVQGCFYSKDQCQQKAEALQ